MSATVTDGIALGASIVMLGLIILAVVGLLNICVILYDRRLSALRQKRTKGQMVTIQPRVNRNPDRRPPKPR